MNRQVHRLLPFEAGPGRPDIRIRGEIAREGPVLCVNYTVEGDLASVRFPAAEATPVRKDELWQDTCMECFLSVKPGPGYWEFNLSPSGHWNVYRFTGYREGMQEESRIRALQVQAFRSPERFTLLFQTDLSVLVPLDLSLAVGLNAVICFNSGQKSHWALAHPGPMPDFHRPDSFMLNL